MRLLLALLAALACALPAAAQPTAAADPFAPITPLIGRTFRGVSINPDRTVNVVRYELVLHGQALRVLHSVGDGAYGGETLIVWDADRRQLRLFYATTAGFYTEGPVTEIRPGLLEIGQTVHGLRGFTELRTALTLTADGYSTRTQRLLNGEWVDQGGFDYVAAPDAEVRGL